MLTQVPNHFCLRVTEKSIALLKFFIFDSTKRRNAFAFKK